MESVQKYLKITQEKIRKACENHFPQFRKACKISHRVRNSFFTALLSVLQLVLLLGILHALQKFRIAMRIARCQISSLILFLAYLIDLAKATKLSKTWILHVFELQLALPWTIQNSPSFLAHFNDKKAIKNTKTCQKLIRNICKGR